MSDTKKSSSYTPDVIKESQVQNMRRRRLLQFGLFGGGALLGAFLLRPLAFFFRDSIPFEKEVMFENFRVVENNEELQFYNRKTKEAIFVIEK